MLVRIYAKAPQQRGVLWGELSLMKRVAVVVLLYDDLYAAVLGAVFGGVVRELGVLFAHRLHLDPSLFAK